MYGNGGVDGSRNNEGNQERLFVKLSIYMIYCDRVYDLLSQKSGKKVKKEHYID